MKREFLENFKVGENPLPKEVVDAIMQANGDDIENAKKPFADYDAIKAQLATAQEGLKAFEGVKVDDLQGQIKSLNEKLTQQEAVHKAELDKIAFDGALADAARAAKARNVGAIRGALGEEKLAELYKSTDRSKDIAAAIEGLKKDNDYLFESASAAGYAPNTGTGGSAGQVVGGMDAMRAAMGLPAQK